MDVEKSGRDTVSRNRTSAERISDRELVITRNFNAPAAVVFDAWTKPELIVRWWAPRSTGMKLVSCEVDLRVGGKYRYVFGGAHELTFFGTYKEVERPTRLAWTDEEQPGEAGVTTVTFTENGGTTTLVMRQVLPTKEALDAMMQTGMEGGMSETFAQLDEFLAESAKSR